MHILKIYVLGNDKRKQTRYTRQLFGIVSDVVFVGVINNESCTLTNRIDALVALIVDDATIALCLPDPAYLPIRAHRSDANEITGGPCATLTSHTRFVSTIARGEPDPHATCRMCDAPHVSVLPPPSSLSSAHRGPDRRVCDPQAQRPRRRNGCHLSYRRMRMGTVLGIQAGDGYRCYSGSLEIKNTIGA